jgi:hypothetical protein
MQLEPLRMNRELLRPRVPTPGRARTFPLAAAWPFPHPGRNTSPEIRRAALYVLRTTARDWGLAARR